MKRSRKRLQKKLLWSVFRSVLLGIEDRGEGMGELKLLTISEDTENFRMTPVPRSKLKKYLEDELVRVPEGKREELAVVLMMEKLEGHCERKRDT